MCDGAGLVFAGLLSFENLLHFRHFFQNQQAMQPQEPEQIWLYGLCDETIDVHEVTMNVFVRSSMHLGITNIVHVVQSCSFHARLTRNRRRSSNADAIGKILKTGMCFRKMMSNVFPGSRSFW